MKKAVLFLVGILLLVGCGTKEERVQDKISKKEGYAITLDGVDVIVGDLFLPIQSSLGEEYSLQEIESCAFEGKDSIYTYANYEIYNFHENDEEKIYTITLLNDSVSTNEGIKIGDDVEKVVSTYGNNYEDVIGAYVYFKEETILTFIFEENHVVSIEYKLDLES